MTGVENDRLTVGVVEVAPAGATTVAVAVVAARVRKTADRGLGSEVPSRPTAVVLRLSVYSVEAVQWVTGATWSIVPSGDQLRRTAAAGVTWRAVITLAVSTGSLKTTVAASVRPWPVKTVVLMRARAAGSTGADLKAFAVAAPEELRATSVNKAPTPSTATMRSAARRCATGSRYDAPMTGRLSSPAIAFRNTASPVKRPAYGRRHVPEERPTWGCFPGA